MKPTPIPSYSDSEDEHTAQAEEYEGVESEEGDSNDDSAHSPILMAGDEHLVDVNAPIDRQRRTAHLGVMSMPRLYCYRVLLVPSLLGSRPTDGPRLSVRRSVCAVPRVGKKDIRTRGAQEGLNQART